MAAIQNTSVSRRVAARIRLLRQARGWTINELVKRLAEQDLKLIPTVLSKLEIGERRVISIDEALAVTKVFGITFEELLDEYCATCEGKPPAGFRCRSCGAEAPA